MSAHDAAGMRREGGERRTSAGPGLTVCSLAPPQPQARLPAPARRLIRRVLQTLSRAPVTIHGDGSQQRQFTYVGDAAQLAAQAGFLPELDFDVVNLGSDEVASVADVVAEVEAASGKPLDIANTPVVTAAHHVQVPTPLPALLPSPLAMLLGRSSCCGTPTCLDLGCEAVCLEAQLLGCRAWAVRPGEMHFWAMQLLNTQSGPAAGPRVPVQARWFLQLARAQEA